MSDVHNEVTVEDLAEDESKVNVVQDHRASAIVPIILFSYIGVLVRLGLAFLVDSRSPLSVALWSNLIGCILMGFIVEQKLHIQHQSVSVRLSFYRNFISPTFSCSALYVGLTTGLCGSITTFSGVMYNSCLALFTTSTYAVSNYLTLLVSIFSSSFVGFLLGRHLSASLLPSPSTTERPMVFIQYHLHQLICPTFMCLTVPILIVLAALVPTSSYTYLIYSVILAPFGSLTRYALSISMNRNPNFPLGTLLANTIGSCLYLGIVAIQVHVPISSRLIQQILVSVITGYCGCLTTVSTLILELNTIQRYNWLYAYVACTLIPVQIVYITLGKLFPLLCSSVV